LVTEAGHAAFDPVHTATALWVPPVHEAARHCVPGAANPLTGHTVLDPVHFSGASHAPADARHVTPVFPATFEQPVAGTHVSTVHGLPSLQ